MPAAPNTAAQPPPPAPPPDRPTTPAPARIAEILAVLAVLASYGRHLAATLEHRAAARGFATIARFFNAVAPTTILAHIQRGLMRAAALQRLLQARAARGHDLRPLAPRAPSSREQSAPDAAAPAPAAPPQPPAALTPESAAAPAAPRTAAPPPRPGASTEPLTLATLPAMAAIEAEVRRSPVGRTLAAICRDLGVSPALCDGMFWNRLFDAIRLYRGSLGSLVLELKRREHQFDQEEWRHPGLDLPEETRDGVRRVLGFFIGETPVDPFDAAAAPMPPIAAAATGPP